MSDTNAVLSSRPVSPVHEMGAYEALWNHKKSSFRTIAKCFREQPGALPSELVTEDEIATALSHVTKELEEAGITDYGIRVHGSPEYPQRLRDATYPVELLYYRGWWDLVDAPKRIAIVGSLKGGAVSVTGVALGKFGSQLRAFDIDVRGNPYAPLAQGDFSVISVSSLGGSTSGASQRNLLTLIP